MPFPPSSSPAATEPAPPSPAPLSPALVATPTFAPAQRGLTVGGLVGTTLRVWWRNAFRFAGVTLVAFAPAFVLGFVAALVVPAMARRGDAPSDPAEIGWVAFVPITLVALTMVVQLGGLTYGAVQHLALRPVRLGAMLGAGFRRALPLVGAGLLAYIAVLAGTLLLVVPGVIVACGLSVALPAVVIERIGPIVALRRSWTLTRGHRFTIFVAALVLGLVIFGANLATQVGMTLLGPLAVLVLLPVQLVLVSLPVLLPAVAYHDLRAAKEGTPTEELARVFE
jgi:hypothetical protein